MALPVPLPVTANRVSHRQPQHLVASRAVVHPPMIFQPSCMSRVLVQIARADIVVLARDHPAKP